MGKMIDSNIEWLGEIPAGWRLVKAKYLFQEEKARGNGNSVQLLSPTQKYGVIPQALYQEITGMMPTQVSETADLNTFKTIHYGDFCISLSSYMGGFEYSAYEGVVSPAYQVFRKKNDVLLDNAYYKLLFKSVGFIALVNMITPQSVRVGRNTPFSKFGDSFLPVPPLEEQKRIAVYLERKCSDLLGAIDTIEKQISALEELKRATITKAVLYGVRNDDELQDSGIDWLGKINASWKTTKLKYHVERIGDGIHGTPIYTEDGEYIFVNGGNLNGDRIKYNGSEGRISASEYKKHYSCLLNDHTVLIALNGANYGNISYYNGEKILLGKSAGYITLKDSFFPRYIGYYLMSNPAKENMRLSLLGTTIPNLSLKTLNNFAIPLPPKYNQQEVVTYLDDKCNAINGLIASKRSSIAKLEEYKEALVYLFITGKKEVPSA